LLAIDRHENLAFRRRMLERLGENQVMRAKL
jgi:hypothetical protein